ncbi:hypothetical protein DPMN_164805 [Dreissena polymorpha]|uniref:Uncharacterized protein n=1 Tax=Dreissena polymorpha TaxID=45954 RepID=A0A9D4ISN9_DREPO|nr:hypothetical protein DPMN_164805 [Dreissena polymorpha]
MRTPTPAQRLQEKTITVEDNTILSPVPSRFANAGRSARTEMIRSVDIFNAVTLFTGAAPVEAGQQPGRVPVNPDWLRFIPCPGESRQLAGTSRQRPGRAPSYGNAPVSPRSSPVMPRRSPGECRDQKIIRDHLPVMVNVPMKFHDPRRKHY